MKKLIIGNWKLNPVSLAEANSLAEKIDPQPLHEVIVCPPTAFLAGISYPQLGAQDCFWKAKGAYTGQTSPATLYGMGIKYCLVGHSERRELGETGTEINAKIQALLEYHITPVVCIGYGTVKGSDDLAVVDTLKEQLQEILSNGVNVSAIVIAYEPVWAIGSGKPASTDHAEKIALFIKTKYQITKVLYGGSTNSTNAVGFLSQPHIDGLLVGGASLLPDDFNAISNLQI